MSGVLVSKCRLPGASDDGLCQCNRALRKVRVVLRDVRLQTLKAARTRLVLQNRDDFVEDNFRLCVGRL